MGELTTLVRFEIKGLFGSLNHVLDFKKGNELTILYGLNGVGKTTILSMLYDISMFNYSRVFDVPFKQLGLIFHKEGRKGNNTLECTFTKKFINDEGVTVGGFMPNIITDISHDNVQIQLKRRDSEFSSILSPQYIIYLFSSYNTKFPSENKRSILDDFPGNLEKIWALLPLGYSDDEKSRTWLRENITFLKVVFPFLYGFITLYMPTQRIYVKREDYIIPKDIIEGKSIKKIEQPLSLFPGLGTPPMPYMFHDITQPFYTGISIPLAFWGNRPMLSPQDVEFGAIKDELLAKEVEKKSTHFKGLYKNEPRFIKKSGIFKEIMDSFLYKKRFLLDREHGFRFLSLQDETIPVKKLSSGEKNLLLIFFALAFETRPGMLVLIDEPEISLHVKWQLDFLDAALKINQINKCHIIIATHSPQIIHDKWNKCFELLDG